MTDGTTIKVLLMVMLLGCIVDATFVPEGWEPFQMSLARTMAIVRSATSWPERALQQIVLKYVPSSASRMSVQVLSWAMQRHAA
jgi:hypothetical protein